jgi:phosphatidate cytidylyltransferase
VLKTRILSALVMLPPALAAMWYGGWAFEALVALAAALMAWEWDRLVTGRFGPSGIVAGAAGVGAAFLAANSPLWALALVAVAGLAVFAIGRGRDGGRFWPTLGVPYIGLPVVALAWLRADPWIGREAIVWLLVIVWATDIGAYAFGRVIGGPKLAPRFSPKKTWAGLVGGVICAALCGWGLAVWAGQSAATIAVVSGGLAIVAQAGDIFESAVKRRFGVKDSSAIIPGHGGVLDRVDGVLPVALLVGVILLVNRGGGM